MTTKLIILIAIGILVLAGLIWFIIRAWRYRRDHSNEIFWPYNDMGTTSKREKRENEK